jgi:hypothetical protein
MIWILVENTIGQVANCTISSQSNTFNQCIRNGIVDTVGQPIPRGTDIKNACNAVINTAFHSQCLCERFDAAVGCYQSFCASDIRVAEFVAAENAYCAQAANSTAPATISLPPITFVPRPSSQPTGPSGVVPTPAQFIPSSAIHNSITLFSSLLSVFL